MKHWAVPVLFGLMHAPSVAQFPFLRSLEVRPGQQRPEITCVAQDSLGLLWVGADIGLFRTDGERVDVLLRTETEQVTTLVPAGRDMLVALVNGLVLRCSDQRCDTILFEPDLSTTPVRGMVRYADGTLCLATYGAGVWLIKNGSIIRLGQAQGLPDEHVNDLALLPDGRLVVATDQGLALCAGGKVVSVFGESDGAPDNLVLSVAVASDGRVWAGTDGQGVFRWTPGQAEVHTLDTVWVHGPVISLAVQDDMVWAGTQQQGVILHDTRYGHASYRQTIPAEGPGISAKDLFVDRENVVWWCDGSDRLYRADPAILFVPEHEGLDLRGITALCTDAQDRIWFATAAGLFNHAAAFSEELQVTRISLRLDPRTPIVSLAATTDGTVWAGTFGSGVIAVREDGSVTRYTIDNGLSNDNILSVRARGNSVWFATLEGVTRWESGKFHALAPEAGFIFDVLPMEDGTLLMATDGHGAMRWNGSLVELSSNGPRTFYTLLADPSGVAWAAGPGTGLCKLGTDTSLCFGAGTSTFDGDLFAVGHALGRLVAFGSAGVAAFHPPTSTWTDLSARFGLEELEAQLNVIATDANRAIWFGCDKGLLRLRPNEHHFDPRVPLVITTLLVNGEHAEISDQVYTAYDRSDITLRFTGLHYTDPAAVRFEYQLGGPGGKVARTRDREVEFPGLIPGTHRISIRAFVGEPSVTDQWWTITIIVSPPWWRLPWVIATAVLVLAGMILLLLSAREKRLRYRDRMEREAVRFQLEALRSQVDPHFLFNSFNTLVDLIETEPQKAVDHVDELSTFFRNILLVRDKDLITVEEELRLLHTYFDLEQRRFGAAIDLRLDVPASKHQLWIVPLTLQLLVENALKHNVATASEPLVIAVEVERTELVVTNPIRPKVTPPRSTGFGLESILKRYGAFTDRPITVTKNDGYFRVHIPLITAKP